MYLFINYTYFVGQLKDVRFCVTTNIELEVLHDTIRTISLHRSEYMENKVKGMWRLALIQIIDQLHCYIHVIYMIFEVLKYSTAIHVLYHTLFGVVKSQKGRHSAIMFSDQEYAQLTGNLLIQFKKYPFSTIWEIAVTNFHCSNIQNGYHLVILFSNQS